MNGIIVLLFVLICVYFFIQIINYVFIEIFLEKFKNNSSYNYSISEIDTVLLSYPRSGNHLTRFIIEYISSKPTHGCITNKEDKYICENMFENESLLYHVDINSTPIVLKQHLIKNNLNNMKKLILIIRDPFESITRNCEIVSNCEISSNSKILNEINKYKQLLNFYDKFTGKKMIIYYDDLINNPSNIAKQLHSFLDISDTFFLDKFNENTDNIINDSKNVKYVCKGASNAYELKSGTNLNYHKTQMTENSKQIFYDNLSANKYLKKYM